MDIEECERKMWNSERGSEQWCIGAENALLYMRQEIDKVKEKLIDLEVDTSVIAVDHVVVSTNDGKFLHQWMEEVEMMLKGEPKVSTTEVEWK